MTGPSAILETEVAELLSSSMGRKVEYIDQPIATFVESKNKPDWLTTEDLVYLEQAKASGVEQTKEFVTHAIEKICGHPAESYEEYILAKDKMIPEQLESIQAMKESVV